MNWTTDNTDAHVKWLVAELNKHGYSVGIIEEDEKCVKVQDLRLAPRKKVKLGTWTVMPLQFGKDKDNEEDNMALQIAKLPLTESSYRTLFYLIGKMNHENECIAFRCSDITKELNFKSRHTAIEAVKKLYEFKILLPVLEKEKNDRVEVVRINPRVAFCGPLRKGMKDAQEAPQINEDEVIDSVAPCVEEVKTLH